MAGILNIRRELLVALVVLTALAAGCGDGAKETAENTETVAEEAVQPGAAASPSETEAALVEKMAAIAKAMEEAPATGAAVLAKHSMTIEEYEAEIYRIAADPALSAAFEKAKNQ